MSVANATLLDASIDRATDRSKVLTN